jgi:transposase
MNKARTFVRSLTAEERQALQRARKSADGFAARRAQVLLASADGHGPATAGRPAGLTAQAARDIIRAFHADGLGCLKAKSKARKDPGRAWDRRRDDDLRALLHRSPRDFGKPTSLWTLALLAAVCHEQGWTERVLSAEAIRLALKRLGIRWKRAKRWLTSPDPAYAAKKKSGTS